jgi:hypothetical protein
MKNILLGCIAVTLLFAVGCEEQRAIMDAEAQAAKTSEYHLPPRCNGCSLDKNGNLTRPFTVALALEKRTQAGRDSQRMITLATGLKGVE